MGQVKLKMLIDYYLGDMKRRECAEDSIHGNKTVLRRFAKFAANGFYDVALDHAIEEVLDDYVAGYRTAK